MKSYFNQRRDVNHSHKIMYYFTQKQLPVLTTLALEFAVFNRWFASIPGPTICNRAFAHYGTSFGRVDMNLLYVNEPFKSIYSRLINANPKQTSKLYYYDTTSSTMEIINLLQNEPELFGTYSQFLNDCKKRELCTITRSSSQTTAITTPIAGKRSRTISTQTTMCSPESSTLPPSTTRSSRIRICGKVRRLSFVYDEHGGIFDHVPPPLQAGSVHGFRKRYWHGNAVRF